MSLLLYNPFRCLVSRSVTFIATLVVMLYGCQSTEGLSVEKESDQSILATVPAVSAASPGTADVLCQPSSLLPAIELPIAPSLIGSGCVLPSLSGELVRFYQAGNGWYCEVSQGKLPVVCGQKQSSVNAYLAWLCGQTKSVIRSRIHVLAGMYHPVGRGCVYLGRLGLLGGMDSQSTAASFTDSPEFLASCENQICDEVAITPGTSRRIPYLIPTGWRHMNNQIHITQEVPELSGSDCHFELSVVDFSLRSKTYQGLLLCANVASKYRKRTRRAGYKMKPVTTSLKLKLEVHLEQVKPSLMPTSSNWLPIEVREMEIDCNTVGGATLSTLTVSAEQHIAHRRRHTEHRGAVQSRRDFEPHSGYSSASLLQSRLPNIAFGASAWREYFGVDVGKEPLLPSNMEDILNSKAPFLLEDESAYQRVGDNHLLTLIPDRVDGEAFTLDKLGELVLRNHGDHFLAFKDNDAKKLGANSYGYSYYSECLTEAHRQTPLEDAPYWVLLPKTILRGSQDKCFSTQKNMLAAYRGSDYGLPHALEVATSLLAHYARSGGERLYSSESHSKGSVAYTTRCSDLDKDGHPLVVGGFKSSGLSVDNYDDYFNFSGVACSRKL